MTTGRIFLGSRLASQYEISWFTHFDRAASGLRSKTNQPDVSRASVIDDHRCGLADNDDSSRKIRTARRFHHGLAYRCDADCNRGANNPSAACEYEMNPS